MARPQAPPGPACSPSFSSSNSDAVCATPEKTACAISRINLWLARAFPWTIAVIVLIAAAGIWRLAKTIRKTNAQAVRTALV